MMTKPCRRHNRGPTAVSAPTPPAPVSMPSAPSSGEPVMRRWPHPVEGTEPAAQTGPALHYVHCALSYQNQLLADIKTLLEQLIADDASNTAET